MARVWIPLAFCVQLVGIDGFFVAGPVLGSGTSSPARQHHRDAASARQTLWTTTDPLLSLTGGGQEGRPAATGVSSRNTATVGLNTGRTILRAATSSAGPVSEVDLEEDEDDGERDDRVPITLISGFLGAGKTSLLQSLLKNRQGVRIGMVVNDLADVNVDAKLMRDDPNALGGADSVELQNGCICCSMSQELFVSINQLIEMSERRGTSYDHIVIESSGISEPKSVRSVFQDAESYEVPLMGKVRLDTMITVVDAGAFLEAYTTGERMIQRPDLGVDADDPAFQQSMVEGGGAQRAVVDLLVEQVECADVLVLNKMDTLDEDNQEILTSILFALNPHAKVIGCTYGNVDTKDVLGVMDGRGVSDSGTIDDHKDSLSALEAAAREASAAAAAAAAATATAAAAAPSVGSCESKACGGGGEHEHAHEEDTHAHSHDHGSGCGSCHSEEEPQEAVSVTSSCSGVTGEGHSHGHNDHADEGEGEASGCSSCGDDEGEAHGHDHSHSHGHTEMGEGTTTAAQRFGIDNFVYRQRRPFHPQRLGTVLKSMPSSSNLALSEITTAGANAGGGEGGNDEVLRTALSKVVRSKGFMWLAFSDKAAMYWSHAGASFEVLCLGRWWDSLDRAMWPPGQEAAVMEDFEGEFGDRRQELVFIGIGMNEAPTKIAITKALDNCLLTDQEMEIYEGARESVEKLPEEFPSELRIRFT